MCRCCRSEEEEEEEGEEKMIIIYIREQEELYGISNKLELGQLLLLYNYYQHKFVIKTKSN